MALDLEQAERIAQNMQDALERSICRFPEWRKHRETGVYYIRRCRSCHGCRMDTHNRILSACLCEAAVSAKVYFATFTIANKPEGSVPDIAKRHDAKLAANFVRRCKRRGVILRKLWAFEYGGVNGRSHAHAIFFAPFDGEGQAAFDEMFMSGKDNLAELDWHASRVGFELDGGPFLPKQGGFKLACEDPERLVHSPGYRGDLHQKHWSWPHGKCDIRPIYTAGQADMSELVSKVTYCLKYVTKDPWRDSKKWKAKPFAELPPFVQQLTDYGPWVDPSTSETKSKWYRRNEVKEAAIDLHRDIQKGFADPLPVDEMPYVSCVLRRHQPALGSHYHYLLGRFRARHAGSTFTQRQFKVGFYKQKRKAPAPVPMGDMPVGAHAAMVQKYLNKVASDGRYTERGRTFFQTDSQHLYFAKGFNHELELLGKDPVDGRDHSFSTLENKRAHQRRMAQGAFFVGMLEKQTAASLLTFCKHVRPLGRDHFKGLISDRDWETYVIPFSGGPDIATYQGAKDSYGRVYKVWQYRFIGVADGALYYVGYQDAERPWWRVRIDDWSMFRKARAGELPSPKRSIANYEHGPDDEPFELAKAVRILDGSSRNG